MFDPSDLTVKQARSRLCELDVAGLEAVLDAELAGKHRSSLVAEIGRAIDMLKTAEEAEEAEEAAPAPVTPPAPARQTITQGEWYKLRRHEKARFTASGNGLYTEKQ